MKDKLTRELKCITLYLVLVNSVWLESVVFACSRDVLVDNGYCITSVNIRGIVQPAVHLIMEDSPIWLDWRGPGEQEAGLQVGVHVRLEI